MTAAWREVERRSDIIRSVERKTTSIRGSDKFGLDDVTVIELIGRLPGAEDFMAKRRYVGWVSRVDNMSLNNHSMEDWDSIFNSHVLRMFRADLALAVWRVVWLVGPPHPRRDP